jgi:DNA (cytosine-5)-methyltransferase 1
MTTTMIDLFCGAGGSSTGAATVPGLQIRMAANHWALAVETHNTNHPDADHACADISQVDPRYFPRTDLLWASPECTNHSIARGKQRATAQLDLFEPLPDEAAERSRATMWDVVRFTEFHRYQAVLVENVVDATQWPPFTAWLMAMDALGYKHQTVFLNSMHAQAEGLPAPQSRDRLYVVLHRKRNRRPDLNRMQRPQAYCPTCDETVRSVQAWKNPDRPRWGRYRSQYVYRCPNFSCRNQIVEPGWLPASTIIDWSLRGQRIGDRTRPLAEKTRRRIAAGIARYWGDPLAVPVEGREGKDAKPLADALRTQTTRAETGLVVPAGGTWNDTAQPATAPLRTRTTRETDAVVTPAPLIAELRGGGSTARPAAEALATVTAGGNHHAVVVPYYSSGTATTSTASLPTVTTVDRHALVMRNNTGGAEMVTPATEPVRTLTAAGHQSVLTAGDIDAAAARVDDVFFRMLEPREVIAAMAFPSNYVVLGTRREQVRMAGNAVTPPAARDLVAAVLDSLD